MKKAFSRAEADFVEKCLHFGDVLGFKRCIVEEIENFGTHGRISKIIFLIYHYSGFYGERKLFWLTSA